MGKATYHAVVSDPVPNGGEPLMLCWLGRFIAPDDDGANT